ncbi:MAG: type II toxin-antitoxin system HicB family antitoxin [Bryobacteraceae bacterium]
MRYPVQLAVGDTGAVSVSFPDFPEAHTFGEDESEALARAVDALKTALSMYVDARQAIPAPSRLKRRQKAVALPLLTEAKLALYEAMRSGRVGKAELARRLNWRLPQVDRLLDLMHASRLDRIEDAFRALGLRLNISVERAA